MLVFLILVLHSKRPHIFLAPLTSLPKWLPDGLGFLQRSGRWQTNDPRESQRGCRIRPRQDRALHLVGCLTSLPAPSADAVSRNAWPEHGKPLSPKLVIMDLRDH